MDRNALIALAIVAPLALVIGVLSRGWPLGVTLASILVLGALVATVAGRLDRRHSPRRR